MPINKKCEICHQVFHPKPANVKKGWGRFCSAKCQYQSFKKGVLRKCSSCHKEVYITPSRFKNSKSGRFFCGKSCQTKWRNQEFSGDKSKLWKNGRSTYRDVMLKSSANRKCRVCGEEDFRVLAVHHVDQNRKNYRLENLVWLCHNCHHLVHSDRMERLSLNEILEVAR